MPLENAQYIHQLEASNPAGSDQLAQGDDHLRMIKAVLKSTFPNITGPVTKTQDELNSTGFSMPIGVITAWYGASGSVPAGWAICNGQTVARSDGNGDITTPDLRDRTIVGAGSLAAQGAPVGSQTSTVNTGSAGEHTHTIGGGEHTHSGAVLDHALTIEEIPAHSHTVPCGIAEGDNTSNFTNGNNSSGPAVNTSTTGGGRGHSHGLQIDSSAHSHTISAGGAHTHSVQVSTIQPSLGLHFIMKV